MVKGANTGLAVLSEDAESVRVGLSWSSEEGDGDADVSVLLLGDGGKVRGDADFLFYNNPVAADGTVQLLGKTPTDSGSEDRISLDLHTMAPDVERVVVAASRYDDARFGDLNGLRLTVADRTGEDLLGFSIEDASTESAFVFGEFYRRGGEWKFRAVGQGYETGLAGLATDFGIDVDDAEPGAEPEPGADAGPGADTAADAAAGAGERQSVAPVAPSGEGVPAGIAAGPSAVIPAQVAGEIAVPAEPGKEQPVAPPPVRRPRTAKKKVTIPKVTKKSLAENESWRPARLFPVPSL
ncbi:TerD family protein, partial [Streptomyces niveus]